MAYKITSECVSCGACAENCPVDAIKQGDSTYEIDQELCANCGSCAANCPAEAIVEE